MVELDIKKFSAEDLIKEIEFKIFQQEQKQEEPQEQPEQKNEKPDQDLLDYTELQDDFFAEEDPGTDEFDDDFDDITPLEEDMGLSEDDLSIDEGDLYVQAGLQIDLDFDAGNDGTFESKGNDKDNGIKFIQGTKNGTSNNNNRKNGNGFRQNGNEPKKVKKKITIPKLESFEDLSAWLRKNFTSEIQKWIPDHFVPLQPMIQTLLKHRKNDQSSYGEVEVDGIKYKIYISYSPGQDELRICLIYDDTYVRLIESGRITGGTNLFEIGDIYWSKRKKNVISTFQGTTTSPKDPRAIQFYNIFLTWYNENVAN